MRPDFLADPRPAAARPGPPAPIETKAGAMPSDDGFWFHNQEDSGPAGPDAAQDGPKQPVGSVQGWPRSFALKDGDLLSESEDFQGRIASGTEESSECEQQSEKELDHEVTFLTQRNDMIDLTGGHSKRSFGNRSCFVYTQGV